MLYDNALLARLYLDAGRALNEPEFLGVAREIFDYVLREMTSPEGGFYSTQDADSEGEEGKFFVWTPEEVDAVIGAGARRDCGAIFRHHDRREFRGREHSASHDRAGRRRADVQNFGRRHGAKIREIREKLFAAREQRVKPGRDEKMLVAWNGMMIGAFAEGYRALHERRYLEAAERAADFVMTTLWDGRALRRSYKDGVARFNAYLEDYAQLAGAMLDVYEASLDAKYLAHARTLADVILERFIDKEKGGFFFTSDDHEELITRSKAAFDGSTPSGNSAAVMALLRLYGYTGDERYRVEAERTLKLFREFIEKQPFGFSHMLEAVDLYQRGPTEVVIVGERNSPELLQWIERLGLLYVPNLAIFVTDAADNQTGFIPEQVRDKRQVDGHVTAYVCREHTCTPPITSFKDLQKELAD